MAKSKSKNHEEMSLEDKLWETAEQLRSSVEVSEYKYIALGLMFLKFISDRFDERQKELEEEAKNPKSPNYCKTDKERNYLLNLKDQYTSKGIFYLKDGDKWSDLQKIASSEKNLGIAVDKMLLEISRVETLDF